MHIRRTPELLLDVTVQPIMFVLLFSFVFGGAIQRSAGATYINYLMAGIFVQTMAFAVHLHRRPARQRPAEGHDRPLPLAADGQSSVAGRPDR